MITGNDINDLHEELPDDETEALVRDVEKKAKIILSEVLRKYVADTRNVTASAMTYTSVSMMEVCVTGLLMMTGGNRKIIDKIINDMIEHAIETVKKTKEENEQ